MVTAKPAGAGGAATRTDREAAADLQILRTASG